MNMEDEGLVKMINLTLEKREAILFFLIVVINKAKMYCLRYWARYVRKGEVKSGGIKIGVTANTLQKYYSVSRCVISIIIVTTPSHHSISI